MMRVSFKWASGRPDVIRFGAALAAVATLSGCSSTAIDDTKQDAAGGATSGGSSSVAGAAAVGRPDYRKQDYPAGPFGTGIGATLENYSFLGWRDPVASGYDVERLEPVYLADFYNPDGRSGTKFLWINASAVWCSVCRAEMADIKNNDINATFAPKGVQLIVTLFEDNDSGPATPLDLQRWGKTPAHSINFPLLLDPGFKLGAFFTSDATPLNLLVDAATMKVVDATMGYSADYWQRVDALLARGE